MKTQIMRKIISIVCVLSLIMSLCVVSLTPFTSAANPLEVANFDDRAEGSTIGSSNSSTAWKVSSEEALSGANSYKCTVPSTNTFRTNIATTVDETKYVVESGFSYTVKFQYLVKSLNASSQATFSLETHKAGNNVWSGQYKLPDTDLSVKADADGLWHTYTKTFVANDKDGAETSLLSICFAGTSGDIIYIDDFSILKGEDATLGFFVNDNGYSTKLTGTVGQALTELYTPKFADALGFYTSSDFDETTKITEYVDENTTVYVKYKTPTITFETKGHFGNTNFTGVVVDPTNPANHVLKSVGSDVNHNFGIPTHDNGVNAFTAEAGKQYVVKFKYYIELTNTTKPITATELSIRGSTVAGIGTTGGKTDALAQLLVKEVGEWKDATLTFTFPTGADESNNIIFLSYGAGGSNATMYFDDFTIVEYKEEVTLNNCGTLETVDTLKVGDTLPAPTHGTYEFDGWYYYDVANGNAITKTTTVVDYNMTYYAMYKDLANLELYGMYDPNSALASQYASIIKNPVGDGKVLFVNLAGVSKNVNVGLSSYNDDQKGLELVDGQKYTITFDYYLAYTDTSAADKGVTVQVRSASDAGICKDGNKSLLLGSKVLKKNDGFNSTSFEFTFTTNEDTLPYLVLLFQDNNHTTGASACISQLYVDNFNVKVYEASTANTVTLNEGTSSYSVEVAVDGALPAPKFDAPAGKVFDGWYTAATGGTKVTTASANGTYYAQYIADGSFSMNFEDGFNWPNTGYTPSSGNGYVSRGELVNDGTNTVFQMNVAGNSTGRFKFGLMNGTTPMVMEDGVAYQISFKYKVTAASGNAVVGIVRNKAGDYAVSEMCTPVEISEVSSDWQTVTFNVVGDTEEIGGTYPAVPNTISVFVTNKVASPATTVQFDDVTVTKIVKVPVTFDVDGTTEIVEDVAGAVISKTATSEGKTFIGWFDAATGGNKVTVWPTATTTLYARFETAATVLPNTTGVLTFESGSIVSNSDESGHRWSNAVDPTDATNNVLKMFGASYGNFNFGVPAANGSDKYFQLEDGAEYAISFDYYIESAAADPTITLRGSTDAGVGDVGGKTGEKFAFKLDSTKKAEWTEYAGKFTAPAALTVVGSTTTPAKNLIFLAMHDATYYIDNLLITKIEKVSITYVVDGATYKTENSVVGADLIAAPAKDGLTFDGWYVGTVKHTVVPNAATTLTAKYSSTSADAHTITFVADEVTLTSTQLVAGSAWAYEAPKKDNYTFAGWYDATLTTKYENVPAETTTVYAKYDYTPGTVSFDFVMDFEDGFEFSNSAYTPTSGNLIVSRGEKVVADGNTSFKLTAFKNAGNFKFIIANKDGDFIPTIGGKYTVQFDYKVHECDAATSYVGVTYSKGYPNLVIEPKVEIKSSDAGSDWRTATITFEYSDTNFDRLSIFVKNPAVAGEKTTVEFDNIGIKVLTDDPTKAIVVYDTDGGLLLANQEKTIGEAFGTLPTPEKDGYEFVKWTYTTKVDDADVTVDFTDASIVPSGIFTLKAVWKLSSDWKEISFRVNGGLSFDPIIGRFGDVAVLPTDLKLDGFKFLGWFTDKSLTTQYTLNTFPSENIVLYAKWDVVPVLVDFDSYPESLESNSLTLSDRYTVRSFDARKSFSAEKSDYAEVILTLPKNTDGVNGSIGLIYDYEMGKSRDPNALARTILSAGDQALRVSGGSTYTVSFKYKVTKGNSTLALYTSAASNTWVGYVKQDATMSLSDTKGEWKIGTITFTANITSDANNFLAIGVSGESHIIFDDFQVITPEITANVYGTPIRFVTNGGNKLNSIAGDPGEPIVLPTPKKDGYKFTGWYTDAKLTTRFTETVYTETPYTLYAAWMLGRVTEDFEEYPASAKALGVSGGYSFYDSNEDNFDKTNIHGGKTSLFRKGSSSGNKAFTLCRNSELALTSGETYTLSFWIKPTAIKDASGSISLIQMSTFTGINAPKSTIPVTKFEGLKEGEWQRVTYTFSIPNAKDGVFNYYVGLTSTSGNDFYIDDVVVNLKGYTGSATGDSSVNPLFVVFAVIISAGSLMLIGKKTLLTK